MNAYHVLAKITRIYPEGSGSTADSTQQKHFFVKAASPSMAIAIVENRVQQPDESFDVQFTVKPATNHHSSGMSKGEEVYAI